MSERVSQWKIITGFFGKFRHIRTFEERSPRKLFFSLEPHNGVDSKIQELFCDVKSWIVNAFE